jgi:predicted alternative tryptophan synthase beta-subunit
MNEEVFNMEIRKFLKKVGVTAQREIEEAVRGAIRSGKLKGGETLKATVVLTLSGAGISSRIDGDIALQ